MPYFNHDKGQYEEAAKAALANIDHVECSSVKNGYRYTAVMKDGRREVIRALATREYALAHLHSGMACSGKTGLGAIFNFGQKPVYPEELLKTYEIRG